MAREQRKRLETIQSELEEVRKPPRRISRLPTSTSPTASGSTESARNGWRPVVREAQARRRSTTPFQCQITVESPGWTPRRSSSPGRYCQRQNLVELKGLVLNYGYCAFCPVVPTRVTTVPLRIPGTLLRTYRTGSPRYRHPGNANLRFDGLVAQDIVLLATNETTRWSATPGRPRSPKPLT